VSGLTLSPAILQSPVRLFRISLHDFILEVLFLLAGFANFLKRTLDGDSNSRLYRLKVADSGNSLTLNGTDSPFWVRQGASGKRYRPLIVPKFLVEKRAATRPALRPHLARN
jgi:hypothetical protein